MVPEAPVPDDLMFRTLGRVVDGWEKLMYTTGRGRPEVREVDRRLPVRVASVRREAQDVVSIDLDPIDRSRLPRWDPGAHVDVMLPSGRMRQYSLTGNPDDTTSYRIAVRRIRERDGGGGGSLEMHTLAVGDELMLKGPRNAFPFIIARSYLFVAGGIGITPILPMVRDAVARGDDWAFVYTGRSRASLAFMDEISELAERFPDRVHVWPDDEFGTPRGERILAAAPHGAALYCCGPPPMIDALRGSVPVDNIDTLHFERFSAPPVIAGEPFAIELASTGERIAVGPDQSALSALRTVRPNIAYSCQQGFCGTCPVRVISGEVTHRDRFLTDDMRGELMATCVSRGTGTVVLDL
ncbi:PDR/VanB family oxidoreductase [Nocardioides cavernaquae]|nr:PDR/VanB family oxidoreductase [Nocardioides cavernaquae]